MKFPFCALTIFLLYGCPSNNLNTEKDFEGIDQGHTSPLLDSDYPIQPVPFTNVSIEDTFWTPRIETNRNITLPYNFKKCEETGRISNFSKAGGLEDGDFEGIFFNDSDVFKVIEGASYSLQVHNDPELKAYLDELIFKIATAQEEDGYLYTNRTINPSKADDKAGEVRWTRLVSHHELYNVGHLYEAAVAHYQATGERSLLDVAIKNANLIDRVFGPDKNMGVPGHQEIEIGLVKLYRVTGERKYLDLAKFFIDQRGNADGHNLNDGDYSGEYQQDHLPLKQQSTAVGHAVRAGYFYAGATDVAALTDETSYDKALGLIWEDIVHKKIYLTGGIGAEPKYEGFGPAYELPNATAYTETCAAIALMLWNHRMFLRSGDVKYMDVFERTLYNGFLAGISMEGNTFFYPNPLESDGVFKFNQGVCGRSPWFDCSCCPVNIVRILPSLPGYVYAVNEDAVYMNLYMSNTAEISMAEGVLSVNQKTNYPWNGKVEVSFNNAKGINANLKLRIPGWNRNEVMDGDLYTYTDDVKPACELRINGELFEVDTQEGYLDIPKRKWSKNDTLEIIFEMPVRKVKSNDLVTANKGKMALERGPIVYCIEAADNDDKILEISIAETANYQYKYDKDILGGLGVLRGPSALNQKTITAIPYYAWAHRDIGPMAVWMKTD
ncbi:glycoside hydrolase family 127 protein [Eudoraea chungangensis]|uniref:glycoside hydrolase family 127 protein n=1 Tax=Eudoraea chungangensis TaxID=1481905 RepID=UPI0023ED5840|nr:glycoside hydrolase family 127 protein [Eudoraea chungangensis]